MHRILLTLTVVGLCLLPVVARAQAAAPVLAATEAAPDEIERGVFLGLDVGPAFLTGAPAPSGSNSGSFDVTASSTDGESGISGYTFPTAAGMGSGWSVSGSGATRTYTYSSGAAQPGSQTVTATNNAGGTASSTFTVTGDSNAPTI